MAFYYSIHYKEALNYKTFNTVENMDKHIRQVLYTFNNELNDTDKAVLKAVWKHSLDVVGCSWMKVKTIADEVNKSVRAVGYALSKIEGMNIIKRIPVMKKRGGNTSNIIQILPMPNLKELPESKQLQTVLADRQNDSIHCESKDELAKNESELRIFNYDLKQESNIKETLLKYAELKIDDIIKNGVLVNHPSSYVEKVFRNEIRKAEYKEKLNLEAKRETKQVQQQSTNLPFYNWLDAPSIPIQHNKTDFDKKVLDELGIY